VAACSTAVPVPPAVGLSDARDPGQAWAAMLRRFVDEEGRVDFAGLAADRGDLNIFIAWVAWMSPASAPATLPTREDRFAYYLNAYNALAMYNVVDAGIPETLAGLRKVPFFFLREVQVGGERMSLHAYENRVIRPLGEERVRFALNCMARGCPRLLRASFTAAGLEPELNRETPRFFAEDRNLAVDAGGNASARSSSCASTPRTSWRAPSPVAYVNRHRDDPSIPDGYEVEFIPYDWRINGQPRDGRAGG
jgi:hypothetical protein